jgi:hypothetical protein
MLEGAYRPAQKYREMNGALALGGYHFIGLSNNQMEVNSCGRSDILEESKLGWSTWGDVVQLFGATKGRTKNKLKINCTVALDSHRLTISMQQPTKNSKKLRRRLQIRRATIGGGNGYFSGQSYLTRQNPGGISKKKLGTLPS